MIKLISFLIKLVIIPFMSLGIVWYGLSYIQIINQFTLDQLIIGYSIIVIFFIILGIWRWFVNLF